MKFTASIFKLGVHWYCHTSYKDRNFVIQVSDAEWSGWKDPQGKMIRKLCAAMGKGKAAAPKVVTIVPRKMRAAA